MTKNIKYRGLAVAIAVATLFAAPVASADTIQLSGWYGGAGSVHIDFAGTNYHDGSSASIQENGGAGGFATYNLSQDPGKQNSFQSWCVDIFHWFSFPSTSIDTKLSATSVFGETKADLLGRLATNHYADVATASTNALNGTAFQLAVWDIVNDNSGYNLSLGNALGVGDFKATSGTGSAVSTANSWLAELGNTTSNYSVAIWTVENDHANGAGSQDVAVFAPIPEPGTYAMMLAGLGLMGFIVRRRMEADAA